ncbi:MAG: TrmH family RNA methyltransferase [Bacillota bacterium]
MKETITSKDNKYIKLVRSLDKKKCRAKEQLFLVEGTRNCHEAVISDTHIPFILVKESKYNNPEIKKIIKEVNEKNTSVMRVEDRIFDSAANTEESQGIMAVASMQMFSEVDFASCIQGKHIAVIDGLQDPGNVGTILRTAWAAGLGGIISVNNSADIYNPKVVRSAMGAVYHLPVIRMENAAAVNFITKQNYRLAVADARGENYKNLNAGNQKIAWLLGSEGDGVSEFWQNRANLTVSIPMAPNVESLNVAVAAGILFFSQTDFAN